MPLCVLRILDLPCNLVLYTTKGFNKRIIIITIIIIIIIIIIM